MTGRFRLSTMIMGTIASVVLLAVAVVVVFSISWKGGDSVQLVDVDISVAEIINQVETERRRPPNLAGSFTPATVGQKLIAGDGVKTLSQSEARIDISFNTASRITRTTPNTIGDWAISAWGTIL